MYPNSKERQWSNLKYSVQANPSVSVPQYIYLADVCWKKCPSSNIWCHFLSSVINAPSCRRRDTHRSIMRFKGSIMLLHSCCRDIKGSVYMKAGVCETSRDGGWWTDIHDMQRNNMRLEMQGTWSSPGNQEAMPTSGESVWPLKPRDFWVWWKWSSSQGRHSDVEWDIWAQALVGTCTHLSINKGPAAFWKHVWCTYVEVQAIKKGK